MSLKFKKMSYFYSSVKDETGEGFRFLSHLAAKKIDFVALTAVPFGPAKAQFTLFPTDAAAFAAAAKQDGIELDGPHLAILAQGEDQIGAFAEVLSKVASVGVNVFSAQGMTDGRGGFGYILYLRPSDVDKALASLMKE